MFFVGNDKNVVEVENAMFYVDENGKVAELLPCMFYVDENGKVAELLGGSSGLIIAIDYTSGNNYVYNQVYSSEDNCKTMNLVSNYESGSGDKGIYDIVCVEKNGIQYLVGTRKYTPEICYSVDGGSTWTSVKLMSTSTYSTSDRSHLYYREGILYCVFTIGQYYPVLFKSEDVLNWTNTYSWTDQYSSHRTSRRGDFLSSYLVHPFYVVGYSSGNANYAIAHSDLPAFSNALIKKNFQNYGISTVFTNKADCAMFLAGAWDYSANNGSGQGSFTLYYGENLETSKANPFNYDSTYQYAPDYTRGIYVNGKWIVTYTEKKSGNHLRTYYSANKATWTLASVINMPEDDSYNSNGGLYYINGVLYALIFGKYIYASTDLGLTWELMHTFDKTVTVSITGLFDGGSHGNE